MPNSEDYRYGKILYNALVYLNPSVSDGPWEKLAERLQHYYTYSADQVLITYFKANDGYVPNEWS